MAAEVYEIDSGARVKADTDDGFLKVANTLMDAMCCIDLNGRQFRFVNAVLRLTYGWKRKVMPFDRGELSELSGIKTDEISRIKNQLIKAEVLIEDGKEIGLNPFVSDWKNPEKRKSKTVQSHSKAVQSHRESNGENCANAQEELCNRTGEAVQSHRKTALPSLQVKDNIKTDLKITSDHASPESEEPKIISRPDAAIQSKNGKQWGTQIDLDSAKYIFDCVSGRTMDTKEPNWSAWANELRLMRTEDKRQPEHIAALFNFADKDSFWSTVILSPKALRRNWGKVAAQYNAARHETKDTRSTQERITDLSWAKDL